MNSLIAKTIYNDLSGRKKPFKIFLDPNKVKDYMHVNDFCEAIVIAAINDYILDFNTDFNISADNPIKTHDIVEKISRHANVDTSYIKWVPETDYLGNHRVNNSKFKIATSKIGRWSPKIELPEGIKMAIESVSTLDSDYNPFKHLDEIENKGINIETHYNFKG
jgi:nucleoside-diphosphate-sugar epimerase